MRKSDILSTLGLQQFSRGARRSSPSAFSSVVPSVGKASSLKDVRPGGVEKHDETYH